MPIHVRSPLIPTSSTAYRARATEQPTRHSPAYPPHWTTYSPDQRCTRSPALQAKVAGATGDVERGRTFALRSPSICTWRTLRRICAPRSRCYAISYGADTGRTLHDGARGRMMPDGFCGRPDYLQFGEV